jgi:hypothetical protein
MKRILLAYGGFLLLVPAIGACWNPFGPDQSVILGVSELSAPTSIAPGSPLSVVLTVQTGGCVHFDYIEAWRDASSATLTAWGTDGRIGNRKALCTADIRYDPHTYQFAPPFANPFTITVNPGGINPLVATVQVQ